MAFAIALAAISASNARAAGLHPDVRNAAATPPNARAQSCGPSISLSRSRPYITRGHMSAESLNADDGEQLQFLVAFSTGDGSVDEQTVRLLRVEQHLAVQFQETDLGVDETLD
jgi:hypothetical protein